MSSIKSYGHVYNQGKEIYNHFVLNHLFRNKIGLDDIVNNNQLLDDYLSIIKILKQENDDKNILLIDIVSTKILEMASFLYKKKIIIPELRDNLQNLKKWVEREKKNAEKFMIFIKKERDYKKKCQEGKLLYDLKVSQYFKQIKDLESNLAHLGFNENLKDESIQNLNQENERLREEIEECKQRLSQFTFEPNNRALLTAIDEVKEDLNIITDEFIKVLDISKDES